MGDISELMMNGSTCQVCGEFLMPVGYPQTCRDCGGLVGGERKKKRKKKKKPNQPAKDAAK